LYRGVSRAGRQAGGGRDDGLVAGVKGGAEEEMAAMRRTNLGEVFGLVFVEGSAEER